MADEVSELKERNRAVWEAGEWDEVTDLVSDVGPRLLDRVGIDERMDVLDVTAKAALGDRWSDLRADLIGLFDRLNTADDGSARVEAQYLVTVGRKSG